MRTFTLFLKHSVYKLLFYLFFVLPGLFIIHQARAQCGYATGLGCSNTDYNNFGYNSNNDPTTIEYDNYVSGYHQTVARTFSGEYKIWGHFTANDGVNSLLVPTPINSLTYPALTGTVLKAAIGSYGYSNQQTIVLTTTGLFALSGPGIVLDAAIKSDNVFSKLTINGLTNGLPLGVEPAEVKMLFATYFTLAITTCSGDVWIITKTSAMRGNNSSGNSRGWYRVVTAESGNPRLTGIVATRGSATAMIALRNDNTIWTWGSQTYLGDGSGPTKRIAATQMTAPAAGTIKMVGATSDGTNTSYYVLYTDGSLYSLGNNDKKQLGDWTTTQRTTWVQPRYNSAAGPVMNDIRWISPMEHDRKYPAVDVINNGMHLYNWGHEEGHDLGRGNMTAVAVDPGMPIGLTSSDQIISVEAGGHTTMFTEKCHENFGYVGHRINGSMGNGSVTNTYESIINYNTAYVPICGAMNTPVLGAWVINSTGDVCEGATILLDPQPAGGVLSVLSGPGTIFGNELTFTGAGSVELQYVVNGDCGLKTITRTFEVKGCTLYKISGMVWFDNNEDAIRDAGEMGTNAGTRLTDGVWANLVDENGKILQSMPVNLNGTYELYTTNPGNFIVRITNQQIGEGAIVPNSSRPLPGDWRYTGHNNGGPCVVPTCTNPDIISDITLNSTNREVHNLDFGIVGTIILPINLTSFDAHKNGEVSQLAWITASEQNNKGFEIHRSKNGLNWTKIGFVESKALKGTNKSSLIYNYTDEQPLPGINYYRLKQTDLNGNFVFSKTVVVRFNNLTNVIAVYPNPTRDVVNIKGLQGGEMLYVLDFTGRRLLRQRAGKEMEKINLSQYGTGLYQIIVRDLNGTNLSFKVLKRE